MRFPVLTVAALCATQCLWPGEASTRVDLSLQVTVAGAAAGGIVWALSIAWSSRFAPMIATFSQPADIAGPAPGAEAFDVRPIVFLPLFVVPLP